VSGFGKCTNATARRRCLALYPLVCEGLRVGEIQERAAADPRLAWVATLSGRTLRRYVRRCNTMAIEDTRELRAGIVADALERFDRAYEHCLRRNRPVGAIRALEAKLRLVGIVGDG
jgi:hypothetical protein